MMINLPKHSKFYDGGVLISPASCSVADFGMFDFIPDEVRVSVSKTFGVNVSTQEDAYVVVIGDGINIYSNGKRGLLYGANDVLRLAENQHLKKGIFYEAPVCERRGLKVYLPSREGIPYFKELIDFLSHFRMNTVMIEIGGAMEYSLHPEINEGWVEYAREMLSESGRAGKIQKDIYPWKKNSIHAENGAGGFITKKEVKELVDYCRERHIEIIPEVPCLSHCDYMMTRHPEIRERQNDDYPDTYCPSNESSYELLFDILDEVIEVFEPGIVNIGHDEFYSFGKCDKCKGKDPVDIFVGDIMRIYDYLKERGIKIMMWAEKLLDAKISGMPCGGANVKIDYDGKEYIEEIAALYPSADRLPKDIEMLHWYHTFPGGVGEEYDDEYLKRGYSMTYGNFRPDVFLNWRGRLEKGVRGGIIANWSTVEEDNIQRNGIYYYLAYANLLYWDDDFTEDKRESYKTDAMEALYKYKYKDCVHGIKILHSTDYGVPYKLFCDGDLIVSGEYDLGYYKFTFTNGKTAEFKVEYGKNISSSRDEWNYIPEPGEAAEGSKITEVTYTTLPKRIKTTRNSETGYEMVYETIFPNPYPNSHLCGIEFVSQGKTGATVNILKMEIF